MDTTERLGFFEDLKTGLEDAVAWTRGERVLRATTLRGAPAPPPTYDAAHVRALRGRLGVSQPYFSRILNVSVKTVQSWEQGTRAPGASAARLLQLIENPESLTTLLSSDTM